MTAPAQRAPGQIPSTTGSGFTGAGGIIAGGTGEWPDLMPPDDAQPITVAFSLNGGQGPGILRVARVSPSSTPAIGAQLHVAPIAVPAVPPAEEYVLTFRRPIPFGGLRVSYENQAGGTVFPSLVWSYASPGRR